MFGNLTRRDFVTGTARVGALAAVGDLAFLHNLAPVSADEARLTPTKVQLSPDIEPLVRLIEDTPREKLVEAAAQKVREGTSYQQLLAAVFLAGVRSIQARPVGFEFHCVLVINSAHLAALASPDRDRWLPLFWSLDNFKQSQAIKKGKGSWVMPPPAEPGQLPTAAEAHPRFVEAMDRWDVEAADRAVSALARTAGAAEIAELFWRYGARDFRDIGHKAIYAANAWRALQTIGWRHAEPVLRSLAFACLNHEGGNPADRDAEPDRPWRANLQRVKQIRPTWQRGRATPEAATELLQVMRTAPWDEACNEVVKQLNREVDPASVWDGLFLTTGELMMRNPGIIALHGTTSVNALHYAYQTSANDETRRLMMLQAAAFLVMFRQRLGNRPDHDLRIDTLGKADLAARGPEAVEEIFADAGKDRDHVRAARKALAALEGGAVRAEDVLTAARRLIFIKGSDSHDYKYSSAALEDYYHASPAWQNRFLASTLFHLKGPKDRDNQLIRQARAALATA
jgi:hypothetical protein